MRAGLRLIELSPRSPKLEPALLGSITTLERARYAHRIAPPRGPLGRALERMNETRGRQPWRESPIGLRCPNCWRRGPSSIGNRIYLCLNPDCVGDSSTLMRFALKLMVTARRGAHLVPLRIARRLELMRNRNPKALLG